MKYRGNGKIVKFQSKKCVAEPECGEIFDTTSTSIVVLEISTKNVFDPDSKIQAPNVGGPVRVPGTRTVLDYFNSS